MNHMMTILILTIVGALIGWITNIFAIKLLFRPLHPIKIPFTPFVLIGLIPKRRAELAKTIGEVVAHELLSVEELIDETVTDEDLREIKGYVKRKIKTVIDEKMSMVPFPFKAMIQGPIDQMIDEEVDQGLNEVIVNIKDIVQTRLNIEQLVEKNINSFIENIRRAITVRSWSSSMQLIFVGGGSETLMRQINNKFPNSTISTGCLFDNCIGNYQIGVLKWQKNLKDRKEK